MKNERGGGERERKRERERGGGQRETQSELDKERV